MSNVSAVTSPASQLGVLIQRILQSANLSAGPEDTVALAPKIIGDWGAAIQTKRLFFPSAVSAQQAARGVVSLGLDEPRTVAGTGQSPAGAMAAALFALRAATKDPLLDSDILLLTVVNIALLVAGDSSNFASIPR